MSLSIIFKDYLKPAKTILIATLYKNLISYSIFNKHLIILMILNKYPLVKYFYLIIQMHPIFYLNLRFS